MIPNGVHRIISAIAASPEIREAMLGDLDEEYQVRAERDGIGADERVRGRDALFVRAVAAGRANGFCRAGRFGNDECGVDAGGEWGRLPRDGGWTDG